MRVQGRRRRPVNRRERPGNRGSVLSEGYGCRPACRRAPPRRATDRAGHAAPRPCLRGAEEAAAPGRFPLQPAPRRGAPGHPSRRLPHAGARGPHAPPRRGAGEHPPRGRLPTHDARHRRRPRPLRGPHGPRAAGAAPAGRDRAAPRPRRPRASPGRMAGAAGRRTRARPRVRVPRRGLPRAAGRGVREPVPGRPPQDRERAHPRRADARLPHFGAGTTDHRTAPRHRRGRPGAGTSRWRWPASVVTWANPWQWSSSGLPTPSPAWPPGRERCEHDPCAHRADDGDRRGRAAPAGERPHPALRGGGRQRRRRLRRAGGRGPRPAGRERRRQEHADEADLRRAPPRLRRAPVRRHAGADRLAGGGPPARHRHGVPGPPPRQRPHRGREHRPRPPAEGHPARPGGPVPRGRRGRHPLRPGLRPEGAGAPPVHRRAPAGRDPQGPHGRRQARHPRRAHERPGAPGGRHPVRRPAQAPDQRVLGDHHHPQAARGPRHRRPGHRPAGRQGHPRRRRPHHPRRQGADRRHGRPDGPGAARLPVGGEDGRHARPRAARRLGQGRPRPPGPLRRRPRRAQRRAGRRGRRLRQRAAGALRGGHGPARRRPPARSRWQATR